MARAKNRPAHAPAHTTLTVPPGHAKALCGELVPVHDVRATGVTCQPCLDVAARTLDSAAGISGHGRDVARRATARAQRRAGRRPRVWLVAGLSTTDSAADLAPVDRPVVRDHLMRTWEPGPDNDWHTRDGRHHATWCELHARFDLVEVA